MFKAKQFRVRDPQEVLEDLAWARQKYRKVDRIFLCDGDALCLTTSKLLVILDYIREHFPECERVTVYGRASQALSKTDEELQQLRAHGMTMVYVGAESGSARVLEKVNKGETREQLIEGVQKLERNGIHNQRIRFGVCFISVQTLILTRHFNDCRNERILRESADSASGTSGTDAG